MKQLLHDLFAQAINQIKENGAIPHDQEVKIVLSDSRQKEHGDYATNVALSLAKAAKQAPRELATAIIAALPEHESIVKTEIAGPGFINIFVAAQTRHEVVSKVFEQGEQYGVVQPGSGKKILVEFVSANPTGPLHVGHGRGAAYGDVLARLLSAAGHVVAKEYYVNDAGRQMDILATTLWLRYLQNIKVEAEVPANAYQGTYIVALAEAMAQEHGDRYRVEAEAIVEARAGLDDEAALDALIAFAKTHLGKAAYELFHQAALNSILEDIGADLSQFGVDYDVWFSEKSLYDSGEVDRAVEILKEGGHLYNKEGAWWFKSTDFGDEKDRVVVRDNGQPTYFASDIAYHKNKVERGFDECINIWGSDHHGYIPRVQASMQALGLDPNKLNVLLVQFATLWRGGEKLKMSTRSGEFVTLRELREEVGRDAARFFYVQRKSEQHMDFDLDLARSQSNENPVYYVQYAHARICSVFRQAQEREIDYSQIENAKLDLLKSEHEQALMSLMSRFPEIVIRAAGAYEPHQITYYLRDLATGFHAWYNTAKFLDAGDQERLSKLALCRAVRQVLANGLNILGVTAVEKM